MSDQSADLLCNSPEVANPQTPPATAEMQTAPMATETPPDHADQIAEAAEIIPEANIDTPESQPVSATDIAAPDISATDISTADISATDVSTADVSTTDTPMDINPATNPKPKKARKTKPPATLHTHPHLATTEADTHTTTQPSPAFDQLGLPEPLLHAVQTAGYPNPTPIQARTIPLLLAGRDVLGQAQTGSGKTAAFALPLLSHIDLANRRPQILVLVPTRELAVQATAAFERYAAQLPGFQAAAIYGGAAMGPQFSLLNRGVHVVVGTPGRVMDHMERGSLKFENLRCLVLDEADEMLKMGFAESVQSILEQLPQSRQTALFSATMPEAVREIAQQHLRNPADIEIRQKAAAADSIRQRYVVAGNDQKEIALLRLLESEPVDAAIIFVRLRGSTEPLAQLLCQNGHRAAPLNGEMPQAQRERIIEQLKSGQINLVVATDVAARGLDVPRITHVINYDLPRDREAYVHRIGRTGRAGRSGEAILFVHPRGRRLLQSLERAARQTIEPMPLPTNRAINKQRVIRFHQQVLNALNDPQHELLASILQQFRREHPELTEEQVLGALGVLAAGGRPLLIKDEFRAAEFEDSGFRDRHPRHDPRHDPRIRNNRLDRPDRPGSHRAPPPFRSDDRRDSNRTGFRRDHDMETFRLEVGHAHDVKPGNIVGAIANEAQLDSSSIGRIQIFDEHSTVDLPAGMPDHVFQLLQSVRVAGRPLRISKTTARFNAPNFPQGPRRQNGPRRPPREPRYKPRH